MKKQVKKQVTKQAKVAKAVKKAVKKSKADAVKEEAKKAEYEAACADAAKNEADRLAARREYARAYYQANREKLVAASARSHAKRNAEARALLKEAYDILSGVVSEIGEDALTRYGDPSILDRLATFAK